MIDINLQSWTEELTSLWFYLQYEIPKWKIFLGEIIAIITTPIFWLRYLILKIKYRHL